MPLDSKKVLWTVISVGLFLVVFFGTALMLFAPRRGAPEAPASVMNQTPPRAADPTEYLLAPVPALVPEPAAAIPPPGEVVIVYGERPPPAPDAVLPVPSRPGAYAPAPPVPAARPPAARPPERPPAPVPRPRTVTVAEWWIQAASPTSRSGAENLRAELSRRGLSAVITLRDVDGTTHYRVRIGPYSTEREALGWRDRIRAIPGLETAYVSRTTAQRTIGRE